MKTLIIVFFLLVPLTSNANEWGRTDVKEQVLSYCLERSGGSSHILLLCSAQHGDMFSRFSQRSSEYASVKAAQLCSSISNGRYRWVGFLSCFDTWLEVHDQSPLNIYSTMLLERNKMRPDWLLLCRREYGNNVSPCMRRQELQFSMFWSSYTNLPGMNEVDQSKFIRCAKAHHQELVSYNFFLFNNCVN